MKKLKLSKKSLVLFIVMAVLLLISGTLGYKSFRTYHPVRENLRVISTDEGTEGTRTTMYEVNTRKIYYLYHNISQSKTYIELSRGSDGKPRTFSGTIKSEIVDE